MAPSNLFADLPRERSRETIEALLETPHLRLERIVSFDQATPPGEWYDQPRAEWVLLLSGAAALRFAQESEPRVLSPGDWLHIAPHARHRVEWTAAEGPTVWLALHHD
jgi:cupin 2 domain-containing protein